MRHSLMAGVLAFLLSQNAAGFDYPVIRELSSADPLFQQQQEDLRLYFARSRTNQELPPLVLYRFDASEHDSILTIAARLNVPYSSLATLNGLTQTDLELENPNILVPNIPGMFVPEKPRNHIDRLLADLRSDQIADSTPVRVARGKEYQEFYFLPGEDFRPDERRVFLGAMFVLPVDARRITSPFGYRHHPITGVVQFHRGVDLAAPRFAPVRAAADGIVTRIGFDALLGTYVVLQHSGGFETYYAHLAKTRVTLNETVGSGTIIGRVGSTGLATGPHLHFEVREAGRPKDPLLLLPPVRTENR